MVCPMGMVSGTDDFHAYKTLHYHLSNTMDRSLGKGSPQITPLPPLFFFSKMAEQNEEIVRWPNLNLNDQSRFRKKQNYLHLQEINASSLIPFTTLRCNRSFHAIFSSQKPFARVLSLLINKIDQLLHVSRRREKS